MRDRGWEQTAGIFSGCFLGNSNSDLPAHVFFPNCAVGPQNPPSSDGIPLAFITLFHFFVAKCCILVTFRLQSVIYHQSVSDGLTDSYRLRDPCCLNSENINVFL